MREAISFQPKPDQNLLVLIRFQTWWMSTTLFLCFSCSAAASAPELSPSGSSKVLFDLKGEEWCIMGNKKFLQLWCLSAAWFWWPPLTGSGCSLDPPCLFFLLSPQKFSCSRCQRGEAPSKAAGGQTGNLLHFLVGGACRSDKDRRTLWPHPSPLGVGA